MSVPAAVPADRQRPAGRARPLAAARGLGAPGVVSPPSPFGADPPLSGLCEQPGEGPEGPALRPCVLSHLHSSSRSRLLPDSSGLGRLADAKSNLSSKQIFIIFFHLSPRFCLAMCAL